MLVALVGRVLLLLAPLDVGFVLLLEGLVVLVQRLEVGLGEGGRCHHCALFLLEFVHFTWVVT